MKTTFSVSDLIAKTHRLPSDSSQATGTNANSAKLVQSCMFALANVGWTLSPEVVLFLESKPETFVKEYSELIFNFATETVGGVNKHYPLFANFPYHSYTAKDWFNLFLVRESKKMDKVTFQEWETSSIERTSLITASYKALSLGGTFEEEKALLLKKLLESSIPLSESDLSIVQSLLNETKENLNYKVSVKENLAVLNTWRIQKEFKPEFPTLTDILRLAVNLSGGDVTLTKKTKFKNLKRKHRRAIFEGIEALSKQNSSFIMDSHLYQEEWKRLGEKLHPHESKFKSVKELFMEVRGETTNYPSLASQQESIFTNGKENNILDFYRKYPSLLGRNLDRVIRTFPNIKIQDLSSMFTSFSSKVIISTIQQLENRNNEMKLFVNKSGKIWFDKNKKITPVDTSRIAEVVTALKAELSRRSEVFTNISVAEELESIAIPLTDKIKPKGVGIYPIGSITKMEVKPEDFLRFFIYWHENGSRTDYDLSCLFLTKDYVAHSSVSFRNLRTYDGIVKHSGDFTSAPNGASEFIDVQLSKLPKEVQFVVPQINKYSGESFDEVKEVFFGYMERKETETSGEVFEPKTVKVKSELTGTSQVAYPVVFVKEGDSWYAKWIHLNLNSANFIGMVENNKVSTSMIVKSIVEKKYFTIKDMVSCFKQNKLSQQVKDLMIVGTGVDIPKDTTDKYVTPLFLQDLIPKDK